MTVEAELPVDAVIGEVAETSEFPRLAPAGATVTLALLVIPTEPFTVAVIDFTSAVSELKIPVICPDAFVTPTG